MSLRQLVSGNTRVPIQVCLPFPAEVNNNNGSHLLDLCCVPKTWHTWSGILIADLEKAADPLADEEVVIKEIARGHRANLGRQGLKPVLSVFSNSFLTRHATSETKEDAHVPRCSQGVLWRQRRAPEVILYGLRLNGSAHRAGVQLPPTHMALSSM